MSAQLALSRGNQFSYLTSNLPDTKKKRLERREGRRTHPAFFAYAFLKPSFMRGNKREKVKDSRAVKDGLGWEIKKKKATAHNKQAPIWLTYSQIRALIFSTEKEDKRERDFPVLQ